MIEIFMQTLPFFALIALGYIAVISGLFGPDAAKYLTQFVFYFALSALLFRFAAALEFREIWDANLAAAYLLGTLLIYLVASITGVLRKLPQDVIAVEAQSAVIGNTGFLGIPLLTLLLGAAAIGPLLLILTIDLVVFSSLFVILITIAREGRVSFGMMRTIGLNLARNPMIVSICAGIGWSALGLSMPAPMESFLATLAAAATPCALFCIGASLAGTGGQRAEIALWLSFCKLILHPAAVTFFALMYFPTDGFTTAVMIGAAAMPVAGNVYILAQHYGVAPGRVSSAILFSTALSIASLTTILALASNLF